MSILQMSLLIPTPPPTSLSSSRVLSGPNHLFLVSKLSSLSINNPKTTTTIRMGGGPRTYPGGVSKWQWKRMQAKKAKQLLKARLTRERQIYEMRKRAELRAAVSELERPWEVVEMAPTLFSVGADEQVKVLADRFQRPGGFDFWSEKDGPQLFETVDGVPSARFFPKGVVHSIKPYGGKVENELLLQGSHSEPENGTQSDDEFGNSRVMRGGLASEGGVEAKNSIKSSFLQGSNGNENGNGNGNGKASSNGRLRLRKNRNRNGKASSSGLESSNNLDEGFNSEQKVETPSMQGDGRRFRRDGHSRKFKDTNSGVYDMSLQGDGSYGFQVGNQEGDSHFGDKNDALKLMK